MRQLPNLEVEFYWIENSAAFFAFASEKRQAKNFEKTVEERLMIFVFEVVFL